MRGRDLVVASLLVAVAFATGCSRLSFIKPSAARGDSEQVARTYDFSGGDRDGRNAGSVRAHLLRGEQALHQGRAADAEAEARKALKIDDRNGLAHTLMALALEQQGRADAAGVHYRKAAELAPDSGPALNNYGGWLCLNGHAAESLAWFDRALADRSYASPASALANAGACAVDGGQPGRAERDLRAALRLDPLNAVALEALARHLYGQGDYFEARAFSQRRLDAGRATPATLLLASQIEEMLGDKAAAARYVQRLRTEFPQAQAVLHGDSRSR
ncbi:type IV pilus biogenesis/stability protein PilW [Luteimonas terricola]|uniref:Type IV pilus biogenesis/stability protein PilW n=1 Tax=Luteimonas terricola TaxID=645597 RepID=A0ABQ2EEY9_9GAMM|nr:type IV pilus biogenesis/stability protein PilW [Luteimonas terricola]GGK06534.1 type IV pilus biogenesis/stability protein PilW [Luteimonas terricola]